MSAVLPHYDMVQHITPSMHDLSAIAVNVPCSVAGCGRTFATPSSLRMHQQKVHRQYPKTPLTRHTTAWYHCPREGCRYHGAAAPKLAKHFPTMGSLKQHWLKVHAQRVLSCGDCGLSFSCHRLLSAHQRSCGLALRCSSCCSTFSSLEALQSHCRRNQGHAPHHTTLQDVKIRLESLAAETNRKRLQCSNRHLPCPSVALNTITVSGLPLHNGIATDVSYTSSISSNNIKLESAVYESMPDALSNLTNNLVSVADNVVSINDKTGGIPENVIHIPDAVVSLSDPIHSIDTMQDPLLIIENPILTIAETSVDKCIGTMSFIMVNRATNTPMAVHENIIPSMQLACRNPGYKSGAQLKPAALHSYAVQLAGSQSKPSNVITLYQGVGTSLQQSSVTASVLSAPVALASPLGNHPPHMLAAIALSELSASAMKRVPTQDVGTQTPDTACRGSQAAAVPLGCSCGNCRHLNGCCCVWSNTQEVVRWVNCKRATRVSKRRKSAETQTRLTHKESIAGKTSVRMRNTPRKCGQYKTTLASSKRRSFVNRSLSQTKVDFSNVSIDSVQCDISTDNLCVLEAFSPTALNTPSMELATLDTHVVHSQPSDQFRNIKCEEASIHKSALVINEPNCDHNDLLVQSLGSLATGHQTLAVDLPTGRLYSAGTQTSPRTLVNVGLVTHGALYEDIALSLVSKAPGYSADSTADLGMLSVQGSYSDANKQVSTDQFSCLDANSSHCNGQVVTCSIESDATAAQNNALLTNSYSEAQENFTDFMPNTNDNILTICPSTSAAATDQNYSNQDLLLEDEGEYVLTDRNLSELSTAIDINPISEDVDTHAMLPSISSPLTTSSKRPPLSAIRSSSIETQTEHDVLLSRNTSSYKEFLSSTECVLDDGGGASHLPESAWCTTETQTCEDFCEIEQYLSSAIEGPEQDRGELFPELSFADTQTQTAIDDSPYLVHSHTQTML